MSKKGTPLFLRNEFMLLLSIIMGAILGRSLYSIGKNVGTYDGMLRLYEQIKK